MKRKLLIGSLISAVFLYLALRDIQWSVLWATLKRTQSGYLVPTAALVVIGLHLRGYRWGLILRPIKHISASKLFAAISIGFMANNLLPARLGELVRAHVIGKEEGLSRTASFATIIYERIVDVFTLLALLGLTMLQVSGPGWLTTSAVSLLLVNIALLIVLSLMRRHEDGFKRVVLGLVRPFPQGFQQLVEHMTGAFMTGLTVVGQARLLVPIGLVSLLAWFSTVVSAWCCLAALDIEVPLVASVAVTVMVTMGSMIPSAPAYVGTTQYACILALSFYGVDKNQALAFSLLFHATQFFTITVLGFYFLSRSRVAMGEITKPSIG